jgi:hypothetical protein
MQHILESALPNTFINSSTGSRKYLSKRVLQSSKSAPTSLKVKLGQFRSFSGEVIGMATGQSAKPTRSVSLADLDESAKPTRIVGLAS